jgi:hypothetical protein
MFDDVDAINAYFADIGSDPHHDFQMIEKLFVHFLNNPTRV